MAEWSQFRGWITKALTKVDREYYEADNERNFHAELYHQMRLLQTGNLDNYVLMCEMEKRKDTIGTRKRPDMIFHKVGSYSSDMFVTELKRKASFGEISNEFEKLRLLKESPLSYKYGFIINIGPFSPRTIRLLKEHFEEWMDDYLNFVEVYRKDNELRIHHYRIEKGQVLKETSET